MKVQFPLELSVFLAFPPPPHFSPPFLCCGGVISRLLLSFFVGGQRNWIQVICNGGCATFCAILYMLEAGCREKAIDFQTSYYESGYALGVLGAVACCCGDTLASELGTVWSSDDPRLITTFRKVPRGISNQSINQSINQSPTQSINQSINQSIKQSINQSINHSINQSINQPTNQSIS